MKMRQAPSKPKVFITIFCPFNENIYSRLELEYLKNEYEVWILNCLDLFHPQNQNKIPDSKSYLPDVNLVKVSTKEQIISLIGQKNPIFLLDSIGKSEYTYTIQSICKSNKLCYVYDASINTIGSSRLKNNFLYFLSLLPKSVTKRIAYVICLIRDTKYIRPDIILSSSSIGTLWDLSARNRILTDTQSSKDSLELEPTAEIKKLEYESFILFLDDCLMDSFDYQLGHTKPNIKKKDYFNLLNLFFNKIESEFNLPVIIAAHPNGLEIQNYETQFSPRKVLFNSSAALSKRCLFAITHNSLSVHYPILFERPIIFLDANGVEHQRVQKNYAKRLGSQIYHLQKKLPKNIFLKKVNTKKYNQFIKSYIFGSNKKILHQYDPLIALFHTECHKNKL